MGYSLAEASMERQQQVALAIENDDDTELYRLSSLFKEEGEDEIAEEVLSLARQARDNNCSYDESIGN